ncbi:hypothetical protein F0267_26050 [Vibrio coralliilyticus]|uniref:hypothetical protein n=1 Tax=Vibrio TaxID=662 RepID=UPI00148D6A64|nr:MULTISPECIES: hypothetical protein [Vibrio]NOH26178.1 hypothetical protein [Vibrio europaeus]NOH41693.1 hypothetical protein [Vibrio coralliilyticus]
MSILRADLILAADGDPNTPVSIPSLDKRMATAWANYSGSNELRDSYNVSSITKHVNGEHTTHFLTQMKTVNYAAVAGTSTFTTTFEKPAYYLTTSVRVNTRAHSGALGNPSIVTLIVFGGK